MQFSLAALVLFAVSIPALAQQSPAPEAAPTQRPCLLVKHKGVVGRRLVWWALIGVPIAPGSQYDYVDSVDFKNSKLAYRGKELEKLEAADVHVIVLNDKFSAADLDSARKGCSEPLP
jgi:hypothetical protein